MEVVLTNMCMVYNSNDEILVLNRTKKTWPGLTFPGGHVEEHEDHLSSVIREMKEETGLDVFDLEVVGIYEWNVKDKVREISILYKTCHYKGELVSSKEGEVFFIKKEDLKKYKWSLDFDKILEIYFKR